MTEPIEGFPKPFPILRDMETHVYMKGAAGKLLVGWIEMDARPWNPHAPEGNRPFLEMEDDWEQAEPFIDAALTMFSDLESAGIRHFLNGPESFTADKSAVAGSTTEPRIHTNCSEDARGRWHTSGALRPCRSSP